MLGADPPSLKLWRARLGIQTSNRSHGPERALGAVPPFPAFSRLVPPFRGAKEQVPGTQTPKLQTISKCQAPTHRTRPFKRSVGSVGTHYYALERLRTLRQGVIPPVGTRWNALVRLRTPFYALRLCVHSPARGSVWSGLGPVWQVLNRRKTGLRRFTPV